MPSFLPLLALGAAGYIGYKIVSSPKKETFAPGTPSPIWQGKVTPYDFGGVSVNVLDEAARLGITRALLRDEVVALDSAGALWNASLKYGVGKPGVTPPADYAGLYVSPALRGLQFVAQALQAGKDVYVPIEWASGDLRKPLPRDPDRSADLYASATPLDATAAKYWARLYDAPRAVVPSADPVQQAKNEAYAADARASIQSMLATPSEDYDKALGSAQMKLPGAQTAGVGAVRPPSNFRRAPNLRGGYRGYAGEVDEEGNCPPGTIKVDVPVAGRGYKIFKCVPR